MSTLCFSRLSRFIGLCSFCAAALFAFSGCATTDNPADAAAAAAAKPTLRHVVLFGFNNGVPAAQIREVEAAFAALPSKIALIKGFEWGRDCSPEKMQKGHTHAFFLTFDSEKDRDAYIVHPAHRDFGKRLAGKIATATVIDYWVTK
jgi:heme-degrading monooxygenase HmoA